ncbi:hypothetical protein H0H81_010263 [Sphagnurus paluster]|uniref:Uncharacterized protein n=1 Tax=Sphagnurus paluster TaxID=117069 RepID=A0A9P7GJR3_9AGAR|nr:hypothetical protein H0H81_010263 [Sphagnurus paluster]
MIFMFVVWLLVMRLRSSVSSGSGPSNDPPLPRVWYGDLVDTNTVDLFKDEYIEEEEDKADDKLRERRINGKKGILSFKYQRSLLHNNGGPIKAGSRTYSAHRSFDPNVNDVNHPHFMDNWPPESSGSDSPPQDAPLRQPRSSQTSSKTSSRVGVSRRSYDEDPRELKLQLLATKKLLKIQEDRTEEVEREILQLATHLKRINDARLAALQEAAKANEELKYVPFSRSLVARLTLFPRLYKIQLEYAQKEIYRAQDVLNDVDKQRHEAENDAARARSVARKLNQEIMIHAAREEGRKLGMQEGLQRGRSLGFQEALADYRDDQEDYYEENDAASFDDARYRQRSLYLGSRGDPRQPTRSSPSHPQQPRPPPAEPSPPPPPPEPIPRHPEGFEPISERPRSFRNTPSPIPYTRISIPPDGYIPQVGADNFIRIPPPHELSRPPPTPERRPSPPLPPPPPQDEPIPVPRHPQRNLGHQRTSSHGSTSTAMSQLDLVNMPGQPSPLSVIQEVQSSAYSTPNPLMEGRELRNKPSWSQENKHPNQLRVSIGVPQQVPMLLGPFVLSLCKKIEVKGSPPLAVHHQLLSNHQPNSNETPLHAPGSQGPSPPPLSVRLQPSSRPPSRGQEGQATGSAYSPRSNQTTIPVLVPMPGSYQAPYTPQSVSGHRMPSGSVRRDIDDDDASVISLSTPPPEVQARRQERLLSMDALMTPPLQEHRRQETGWESALRDAGSPVPIPFDNQPARRTRPLSRNTNRTM